MVATVFVNGRIFAPAGPASYTSIAGPFCEAMLVVDDKIARVAHTGDEQIQLAMNGGAVIDLQGRVMLPGFVDSHVHLLSFGSSLQQLDLFPCKNVDDVQETIWTYARSNPSERFLVCKGWMQATTGGEFSNASILDDLDPRPIFINSMDMHSVLCNTAAIKAMKLDSIPEPAGGTIYRDENGKPTGLLAESALGLVRSYLDRAASIEDKLSHLDKAVAAYTAEGYTGLIDMGMDDEQWAVLDRYRSDHNGFPLHIAAHW